MWILWSFGILVVVCNHGKHRSLSLGDEIATAADCELVSPRDTSRRVWLRDVRRFLSYIAPRLKAHVERFGDFDHPIRSIGVCNVDFDGPEWMNSPGEGVRTNPEDLHVLHRGDLVVEWTKPTSYIGSWSRGTVIHGLDVCRCRASSDYCSDDCGSCV